MKNQPVAVVTGASSGFGLLGAVELAKRGFRVVATMRDPGGHSGPLEEMAGKEGVRSQIKLAVLDVTDADNVKEAIVSVEDTYGRIDVLVNNAGYAQGGFVEDVSIDAFRRQFETNVWGTIAMTKAVLPHMRSNRRGTIINMSSVSGRMAFPGFAPYAASKYAIEGFSEALRLEMRPFGVHVALIEPGSYQTNIWEKGFAAMAGGPASPYAGMLQRVRQMTERSAQTGGDPRDVARLIARIAVTRHPKLRYTLPRGISAMLGVKSLLPWSWYEAAVGRRIR